MNDLLRVDVQNPLSMKKTTSIFENYSLSYISPGEDFKRILKHTLKSLLILVEIKKKLLHRTGYCNFNIVTFLI